MWKKNPNSNSNPPRRTRCPLHARRAWLTHRHTRTLACALLLLTPPAYPTEVAPSTPPTPPVDLWQIYQTARDQDAQYLAAALEYQRAQLDLPRARAGRFPRLTLQASTGSSRNEPAQTATATDPNDSRTDQLSLNLQMPLYDRAQNSEVRRAKLLVARAQAQFSAAEDNLILRTADRYFQVLAARDSKQVAESQQAAVQRQMDLTRRRLEVGLSTPTDLYDAQARHQQVLTDVIQANNQIANANLALKQILGTADLPQNLAPLGKDANLNTPEQPLQEWVTRALRNNLTLQTADHDVSLAEEHLTRQRAARWPRLGLELSRQQLDTDNPNAIPGATTPNATAGERDTTALNTTLTWTLFNGGLHRAQNKQAALQHYAAQQNREAVRRQVEADATAAYLAVTTGLSQIQAWAEAVRAGESALAGKESGFRAGLTTNLDVLDAQRDLTRFRTEHLRARYDFILALLRLEQIVDDLDETDLQRINAWLTH